MTLDQKIVVPFFFRWLGLKDTCLYF